MHWTKAQQWQRAGSDEIVRAGELIARYGAYLRVNRLTLIDLPRDQSIRMDDGTTWSRTGNAR